MNRVLERVGSLAVLQPTSNFLENLGRLFGPLLPSFPNEELGLPVPVMVIVS